MREKVTLRNMFRDNKVMKEKIKYGIETSFCRFIMIAYTRK